jgi:hypothetical protein
MHRNKHIHKKKQDNLDAWDSSRWSMQNHEEKKLRGFSPQANYNDRATAACRRSQCQL